MEAWNSARPSAADATAAAAPGGGGTAADATATAAPGGGGGGRALVSIAAAPGGGGGGRALVSIVCLISSLHFLFHIFFFTKMSIFYLK